MMKHLLAIILFFLFACPNYAAIYQRSNSNGNVIYSDVPTNSSQPVNLPHSNATISTPTPPTTTTVTNMPTTLQPTAAPISSATISTSKKPYTRFMITAPIDQETFQNQRDIPVTIAIEPSLQAGDVIQLFLDGKPTGEATTDLNQLVLHQIDRGEHQIAAALLDDTGHLLKKVNPITIFIHYSAIPTGSGAVPGSAKTAP